MKRRAGRWELVRRLGQGGMGEVWLGRDPARGEEVAVKLLGPEIEPEQLLRFEREARALAAVRHPGVVRWLESGRDERGPWIAMEVCPGGSLEDQVRESGPLPLAQAVELARELCAAIAGAHQAGVLHRDVKPSNVLFDREGRARLTDFGLTRPVARGQSLTATGTVMGTPGFLAPEQVTGDKERIGPATDVYGLGATLFYLLTGRPPIAGDTPLAGLAAVVRAPVPPPSTLRPGVPPSLDALVLRCLAKSPAERYPHALALRAALGGVVSAPGRRGRRAGLVLISVGVLALAVAGLGGRETRPASEAPTAAEAALARGEELFQRHEYEAAIGELDRAIALDPGVGRAHHRRGSALLELGRYEDAIAAFDRAIELAPEAESFTRRGFVRLHLGRLELASADLDRAIELDPRQALAYAYRAQVRSQQERHREALEDYDRSIVLEPDAGTFANRGSERMLLGEFQEALGDLDRAVELGLDGNFVHHNRGVVLQQLGKLQEATAAFDQALELDPRDLKAWILRGQVRGALGQFDAAVMDYGRALELDPVNWHAYTGRAYARGKLGLLPEALEDLEQAARVEPGRADHLGRGILLAKLNRHEEAIAAFDRALEPGADANCLGERGKSLLNLQRFAEAAADLERALALAPGMPNASEALAFLGVARHGLGEYPRAIEACDRALSLDPRNAMAWAFRGLTHASLGDSEATIRDLGRAVELDPGAVWAPRAREILDELRR